ncbi:unnamed protein product [Cochlearia groenlandica]
MQKKREICEYRDKLDKTLYSSELTNHDSLRSLLKDQLCSSKECNEKILDKRRDDVSNLLSKLRSVSMTEHHGNNDSSSSSSYGHWKLKHDLEDCRVMYREGLNGSPFHTMLVEGYMDGPVQDCLCVSWETTLYNKWWPQIAFPPFRILETTCLQKVGIGEQICLVRMKVPWPLSNREIVLHYFLFDYSKDGLVVIVTNTISDLDSIGVSSKDIIPESKDAVRIDLIGGFVLQKVTPQRSYFRTIADLDIKLDFVPPSLMNFVSKQLIGSGFRLYKKSVDSVAKFDEDYNRALADPLYTKIRQGIYSTDKETEKEPKLKTNEVNGDSLPKNKHEDDEVVSENEPLHHIRTIPEIEEEEDFSESVSSEEVNVNGKTHGDIRRQFCISPQVEQALGTLDKVIYMVRNTTPVQEAPNREEYHTKQVSVLNNVPQRSQKQDFSALTVTQEDMRKNETGGQKHEILNNGEKNTRFQRKRKTRCFAFKSWL